MMLTFDIKPLSINDAWQGRRWKSKEYRQYEEAIGKLLLNQKNEKWPLKGPLEVFIEWYLIRYKATDWDNPIKPIFDILQKYNVIVDDKHIIKGTVTKHKSKSNYFTITIIPYKASILDRYSIKKEG